MKRRKKEKLKTNYRMVIEFGKNGKIKSVADGQGWAKSKDEAIENYNSVLSGLKTAISARLYFEGELIKKM